MFLKGFSRGLNSYNVKYVFWSDEILIPGARHEQHFCVCTKADDIGFLTWLQDAKIHIYFFFFCTVLLLSQLATSRCFTFFSGIQQWMRRELVLLVRLLVDTTVHQSCAWCNLCRRARDLAWSTLAGDAGTAHCVASCPRWPVHKENMTLQVLRTGTFFIRVQEGNLQLSFFNRTYWFALQGWEENMHFICFDSWPSVLHLSAVLAQRPLAEEGQGLVALLLPIRDNAWLRISAFSLALWWHL